jgi:SAM-dependent methyltransferase
MTALPEWILDVVACPQDDCGGRLAAGSGVLRCRRCATLYPVVAGVAVLVPAPAHWMRAHRDAVLATLAEHGAANRAALTLVDAFAGAAPDAEPSRFGDDWIDTPSALPPGAVGAAVAPLFDAEPPEAVLDGLLDGPLGTALDLGCGDGALSERLARRAERLVVADLSLRAVLRARRRARRGAAGIVADAEHLPLARGRLDAIAAANLIDLLDAPADFLAGAATTLRRRGRLALSTPQPGLGDPDDDPDVLRGLLEAAGLRITADRDGVPWLRRHRARYLQIYTCWAAVARR